MIKTTRSKSKLKRKKKSHAEVRLNLLKQIAERKPYTQKELDETDLCFSSMAKIVKKLPRYKQAQLRMQIRSLVGNAGLRYVSMDLPPVGVSPIPSTSYSNYSKIAIPSPSRSTSAANNYPEIGNVTGALNIYSHTPNH